MAARRDAWMMALAVLAIVFGVATLRAGGSVLFGSEEARRAAGAYVGFVVWFNFLAGFAYVATGIGLWLRRRWGFVLAAVLAIATLAVFAAFGLHVAAGGAWEPRTVGALTLRTVVWAVIAAIAWRRLGRAV